jgi:hypothetical protein
MGGLKMRKGLLAGLGFMFLATGAMAEDVKSTKKAAILTPLENMYGRVEARHTSLEWLDADKNSANQVTGYSLHPRLGTKMFNNRLDTYVETPLSSSARSSNFSQKQSVWVSTFNAFESEHFTVIPYHESKLAHENNPFSTIVALNLDAFTSLKSSIGEFTVHGGLEPRFNTGTRETMTSRVNRDPGKTYSLVTKKDDGSAEVKQQEPDSTLEYIAGVAYVPFAPKFRLSTDTYFDRVYHPVYNAVSDEKGERLEKSGYALEDSTMTDVILSYQADSLTTIQNRTLVFHEGLYAANYKGKATPRIQNRLSLIYKLF